MRGQKKAHVSKKLAAAWDAIGQGAPELLDDLDLQRLKKKPLAERLADGKPEKPREQPELQQVQRPLVVYLRNHLPPGSVVFAITNHARSRNQIFALIRDGMLPGVPDLCVIVNARDMKGPWIHGRPFVGFIECKAPDGGVLSDRQTHVQAELRDLGIPVLPECRSKEQAVTWLKSWGVKL